MDTASQSDHDLLIELRTEMRGMRIDIKNIADGTSVKIADHETRIRGLETASTENTTAREASIRFTQVMGAVLIFTVGIAEFIMQKYL